MQTHQLAIVAIVSLTLLNAFVDILHIYTTYHTAVTRPPPLSHYTFLDEDYPPRMPLPSAHRAVKLTVEDSARFGLWESEAYQEWLWTATAGDGNVHYSANNRLFVVAVTHQLHCMRSYRQALEQDTPPHGHQIGHLTHCLNFLRMSTLCAADTTLEPPDAFTRNHTQERGGGELQCMDWPAFYDEVEKNYLQWDDFRSRQSTFGREL